MSVLDLKDAYYHLPVYRNHQQFLRMAVWELGWIINWEKSKLEPTRRQMFLGVLLDSEDQSSFLPEEKKQKIIQRITANQKKGSGVTKNSIARWIREAICLAYSARGVTPPEGIRAHSTRAMASSWAEKADVPIEMILQAAGSASKDAMGEGPSMTSWSCDRDVITGPALIPTLGPEAAGCAGTTTGSSEGAAPSSASSALTFRQRARTNHIIAPSDLSVTGENTEDGAAPGTRRGRSCRTGRSRDRTESRNDKEKFEADLLNIARTTLSSKLLTHHKDHFSKLAVEAVLRLKGSGNLEAIHIIKKLGGSLTDSYLDEGFLLDKKIGVNQPKRIENAKILIANTGMDTDKIKVGGFLFCINPLPQLLSLPSNKYYVVQVFGSRVRVDSTAKVAEIELAEKEKMKEKVERILKHGINCFINRQLIYNYPEQLFASAGVMAIEHADFVGLSVWLLLQIASTFDHPELVKLGTCKLIEEVMIGEDKLIHFSGVAMGEACTIVLRGATQQILDEAERSLHDALCVLSQTVKDTRTMLMAHAVADLANRTPGKESVAMESFAKALQMLPTIIADNAGYDSADLVSQLRAAHSEGKTTYGLDMRNGIIGDMEEVGVTESFQVKRQVLLSAAEAAEVILRVDNIY
ncbi:unnamed protein product [Ranitomeya imitator]|uniref:T-complex protein 1 subunit beta n=1 Tax=Ranitomeya imitator TaxID=111125 RepID=A0ABN9MBY5_9NEOB|nr:unnamed protein product [Ranitomeya imitator]